jgi:phage gp46-like protein
LRFHAAQLARIRAALQREEAGAQRSEWKNETAKSEVSSKLFPMRREEIRGRRSEI